MADYETALSELGFAADDTLKTKLQEWADHPETGGGDMSHNGAYKLLAAYSKGNVIVVAEQNTAPEDMGDGETSAVVTYPKLLIVEGPNGRCAVRPADVEALKAVIEALS